jgi:hypothetical protein
MNRLAALLVALMALAGAACGGGEDGGSSPTGPTGTGGSQSGCSLPGAPGNLAVTTSGTSVVLSWSAVNGAMEYIVLVGTSPSSSNTLSTNTSQPTYPWSGVPAGSYYARVQARNSCGTSGSSNEVRFTIP